MSAKTALAPGQYASSSAASWLVAATRISTISSRVRTTVRSALVSAVNGQPDESCDRSRRYPPITAASPASDFAPDSTSPSRQDLIAFGLTGTTGYPASSSTSTSRPSGRSIATGTSSGSSDSLPSRRSRPANPSADGRW